MTSPFVTIITPVYNGEKYLSECVESILNQQYTNWEYIIVNNCSTDSTLNIAVHYAEIDLRIRIVNNSKFVDVIQNHNIAFNLISSKSKYCKVVSADDWITPDCLKKMVRLAEAHPEVGIVGSYQLSGGKVRWKGIPHYKQVISGCEVCRSTFLNNLDVFGTPTSVLYRSDLIRNSKEFFQCPAPYADTMACFNVLKDTDFGFVHEILSIERIHDEQVSSSVRKLHIDQIGSIEMLLEFGPVYLKESEFDEKMKECMDIYYRWLGGCVLKMKNMEFWKCQSLMLGRLGYSLQWGRVIKSVIAEFFHEIKDPGVAFQKFIMVLKGKY